MTIYNDDHRVSQAGIPMYFNPRKVTVAMMTRFAIASLFVTSLQWATAQDFPEIREIPEIRDVGAVPTETIAIASGQITGLAFPDKVKVYRGIPFAAPPVGDLRWKPPRPVQAWKGVRKCDRFGSQAVQMSDPSLGSEDCLYLNVWTNAKEEGDSKKRPVVVWIHGGGFANGSGDDPDYDGKHFAKLGVVVVTINYRLGALGFFSHPALSAESKHAASGNYGILDQIAALNWVRNNISQFGGDPKTVAIFGQSAGATSVYLLIASPLSKGLFHRAILQSPWLEHKTFRHLKRETFVGPSAESANSKRVADLIGDESDVLAALRKMPASEVNAKLGDGQRVVIDGWLLPDFPHQIMADGKQNQVPTIVGTTGSEGTMFLPRPGFKSIEEYQQSIRDEFGDQSQAVLDLYGVDTVSKIRKATIQKITDSWFVQPAREFARAMTRSGNEAWMYSFTRKSPTHSHLGATHGAEIQFVFNTLERSKNVGINRKLAVLMIQYWGIFSKYGNPNFGRLPKWPAYVEGDDQFQSFGGRVTASSGLRSEACDVYDAVFEAMRKRESP